jgi:hypothetical protein
VTLAAGILSLLTGLAYTGLGVITAWELARDRGRRGISYFGAGFLAMAATCGPHHLVHALHFLLAGAPAPGPLVGALAVGVVPGLIFIALRVEAAFGGRGDRLIPGSPLWLGIATGAMLAVIGATLFEAVELARDAGFWLGALAPNLILAANYLLVGVFTARTQHARRPVLAGWSLSGVAMSGVFVTCGASHLVAGLTTEPNVHTLTLDNLGVPASFFFLWVVHRLHTASLRDWNRAPLVGRPAPRGRRSPWAAEQARS